MNERTIASKALEQLRFQTGLVAQVSGSANAVHGAGSNEALVEFESLKTQLMTHLKESGSKHGSIAKLIESVEGANNLVIGDYISEEEGELLRDANINYLDNVGNAYINLPPVYVFIQGKKPRDDFALNKEAKLFTETGLRVIFALLLDDEMLNASYRKIADHAGVSMGTIGWVLREIKNQGFTKHNKSRYAWRKKSKLVKKWVEEYPLFRSKFSMGVYYTQDPYWWQSLDYAKYEAILGGEVSISSNEFIKGFKPKGAELFIGKHKHQALIRDLDLIPEQEIERLGPKVANKGLVRIELLNKFWGSEDSMAIYNPKVPPLLTYASLLDSWDPVRREVAAKTAARFLLLSEQSQ